MPARTGGSAAGRAALEFGLRAGAGVRLLVAGDRGHSSAVRTLLGSVIDGVVNAAGCPVAVVHDYERRGAP